MTLALRPLRLEDAVEMTRVLADPDLYRFTGGEPPTREELERRYAVQVWGRSVDGTETWINDLVVLGRGGEAVGYVQATITDATATAEVAWVIGRPWQGRGYAARAASLLVDELQGRGVTHIVAHIHPDHTASQRVARGLGLAPTGVVVDGEERWAGPLATP